MSDTIAWVISWVYSDASQYLIYAVVTNAIETASPEIMFILMRMLLGRVNGSFLAWILVQMSRSPNSLRTICFYPENRMVARVVTEIVGPLMNSRLRSAINTVAIYGLRCVTDAISTGNRAVGGPKKASAVKWSKEGLNEWEDVPITMPPGRQSSDAAIRYAAMNSRAKK